MNTQTIKRIYDVFAKKAVEIFNAEGSASTDLPGISSTRSYLRAAPGLVDVACCRWNSTGVMYCSLECGRTSL